MKDSVRKFEEKLTEINELEGIKKAKEILSKAKVKGLQAKWCILTRCSRRMQ